MADADSTRSRVVQEAELQRAGLIALGLLLALNVTDLVLTRLLLDRGGVELNPLADHLLASNSASVGQGRPRRGAGRVRHPPGPAPHRVVLHVAGGGDLRPGRRGQRLAARQRLELTFAPPGPGMAPSDSVRRTSKVRVDATDDRRPRVRSTLRAVGPCAGLAGRGGRGAPPPSRGHDARCLGGRSAPGVRADVTRRPRPRPRRTGAGHQVDGPRMPGLGVDALVPDDARLAPEQVSRRRTRRRSSRTARSRSLRPPWLPREPSSWSRAASV